MILVAARSNVCVARLTTGVTSVIASLRHIPVTRVVSDAGGLAHMYINARCWLREDIT